MMIGESAVIFVMPQRGHLNRLRPLISALVAADIRTYVFTDPDFQKEVERMGGRFVDLFANRPIEAADATSLPIPCRYVSFAGFYADHVVKEVEALRPAIVIHDTFAVIGVPVAHHLGLPRVNVCAGHNLAPTPTVENMRRDLRMNISEQCRRAVRSLREHHGMPDASPLSFVSTLSPTLNIYCEPPEFLRPEERKIFQPIAFFGSLSPEDTYCESIRVSPFGEDAAHKLRIYVSFGTVVWRYYETEALNALEAISEALSIRDDVVAVISLGGREPTERTSRLARHNVRVERYVDQWTVLRGASVFFTHHGLSSTHEAIFHLTPMISYPFLSDQPDLAKRCQELGLAVPLTDALRGPIDPAAVRTALAAVASKRDAMRARLTEARRWEIETIHGRGAVIERILRLIQ